MKKRQYSLSTLILLLSICSLCAFYFRPQIDNSNSSTFLLDSWAPLSLDVDVKNDSNETIVNYSVKERVSTLVSNRINFQERADSVFIHVVEVPKMHLIQVSIGRKKTICFEIDMRSLKQTGKSVQKWRVTDEFPTGNEGKDE